VTREPVRPFERLGDIPPHVHQHSAEVENDSTDGRTRTEGSLGGGLHEGVR
jgi:hypothetical protein